MKGTLSKIIAVIFIFASSLQIVFAKNATVIVREEIEIKGDIIYLGDIAEITGNDDIVCQLKSLDIRKSPLPGYYITITASQIEMLLKHKGFDINSLELKIPEHIKVTKSSQTVSGKLLVDKAVEFLKGQLSWKEEQVKITVQSQIPDSIVPLGEINLLPSCSQNTNSIGNISVFIEILVNKTSVKKLCVTLNLKVYLDVITAKKDIKSGELLSSDMVEIENREITQFNRDAIISMEQIKDKVALTGIKRGTIITEKLIASPVIVHQGDQVYIVAKTGSIEVRAIGKARQNGRYGDTINVVNIDSGKILQGTVIEPGTVLINVK